VNNALLPDWSKRKRIHIDMYHIGATAIISIAALLRVLLISQGWPEMDSDQSIMGLMAMHIAYRGEHPVFFYGQHYMGSLEAFLVAPLFSLFGPSTFTLRLGVIFLFILFLISMYLLTRLLYSKQLALATLILLSLGSSVLLQRELATIGGYQETIFFGSVAFLLATWLALSSSHVVSNRDQRWRLVAYAGWGLAVGLGIWSDFLILPFVLGSGMILVVCCWREWRSWAPVFLVLGCIIGAFPFISANLTLPPAANTFSDIAKVRHEGADILALAHPRFPLINQARGAFLISLPTETGINPYCNVTDVKVSGFLHKQTFLCSASYLSWSAGVTLLWLIAVIFAVQGIKKIRHRSQEGLSSYEQRQTFIRHFARLMLLGSAGLTMLLYVISPSPAVWPTTSARYLFGILIATPAIISPLWGGFSSLKWPLIMGSNFLIAFRGIILLIIGAVYLLGTISTLSLIPQAQAINQQQELFIHDLLQRGITRIYADYWTCDRTTFQSKEKIICSDIYVLNGRLQAYDRFAPNYTIVHADPHAVYTLRIGSSEAKTFALQVELQSVQQYYHFRLDGYDVYQPR
jgi:4-amino-4-deoxy-L-arabinose transferase-like glycosyltransferase